jgi:RimJ/RimL family protein N-acetyltransferase
VNTRLTPINTPELIEAVAGWLSEERNYRWLDFGNGVQALSPVALKIMVQRDVHALRAFTADDGLPVGVVGLSSVDRAFKTATIWIALGDKRHSRKGYALLAAAKMLTFGFRELGLAAINAWAVECNHASLRIIRRLGFRPAGRLRRCHYIDGRAYDRLLFDLLAEEHQELDPRELERQETVNG